MNTGEIATKYRLMHWAQALKERNANGESIKEFCESRDISRNTYFYWQRKLREVACDRLLKPDEQQTQLPAPVFAEAVMEEPQVQSTGEGENRQSEIRLVVSGIRITTDSAYPIEKLASLLRELTRL